MPAGVRGWDNGMSCGKESCVPLGMGSVKGLVLVHDSETSSSHSKGDLFAPEGQETGNRAKDRS